MPIPQYSPPFTEEDYAYMGQALALGQKAMDEGEIPIGALLVANGQVLSQAANGRKAQADPLGHAECLAIQKAGAQLGTWNLTGATLYVTLEPCMMCLGAAINARISRLVYGAKNPKAGFVSSPCEDPDKTVLDYFPQVLSHGIQIEGGLRAQEAGTLLRTFFRRKR